MTARTSVTTSSQPSMCFRAREHALLLDDGAEAVRGQAHGFVDAVPAGEVAAQPRNSVQPPGVDRGHAFRELYDVVLLQSVEHVAVEGRGDDRGEHGTEGDEEEGV